MDHHAHGKVHVCSAGSQPGAQLDTAVLDAMTDVGPDLTAAFPKSLTDDVVRAADVVITTVYGDACPTYPGKTYLDRAPEDPADQPIETVRRIRDEIETRALALIADLTSPAPTA